MSIKEAIVNNIVEGISTKEPLYKITYILPTLDIDDEDYDEDYEHDKYTISCKRKTVIWDKTTYKENVGSLLSDAEKEDRWLHIIDPKKTNHCIHSFGYPKIYEQWIVLYKLSVELIN